MAALFWWRASDLVLGDYPGTLDYAGRHSSYSQCCLRRCNDRYEDPTDYGPLDAAVHWPPASPPRVDVSDGVILPRRTSFLRWAILVLTFEGSLTTIFVGPLTILIPPPAPVDQVLMI
jgi:hypothetical protein